VDIPVGRSTMNIRIEDTDVGGDDDVDQMNHY
jgi:hypothetical protein